MNELTLSQIEKMIYIVRGQRVMLDSDLAKLYGVETRSLNQAVKRNLKRFPEDFMFQLTFQELSNLRSQIVISSMHGGTRHKTFAFTENGVAMLSTVLKSEVAIEINISIMRIFTRLKSFTVLEQNLKQEISELKDNTGRTFKIVFERLDDLEATPETPNKNRKKIGLKNE
ncbi:MAG: ORF6N domain-containing protein [Bacteriovoracaceae bacterium]|nr:ORF6N domain-containing protein [Bacteriovoracaceae bacterium]